MKIVTVIENISLNPRLEGEFGLSLMLETEDDLYLIDTGASDAVVRNLKRLGFYPSSIRNIIISHNHDDHMGGLASLLEINNTAAVYLSEYAVGEYVKFKDGDLSILSSTALIFTSPERFQEVSDIRYISDDVALCSVRSPDPKYTVKDKYLFEIFDGKMIPDNFKHEIYVCAFDAEDSYNIISPCSHNGIINIINDAKTRFPHKKLNAYVGGLHLQGHSQKLINYTETDIIALSSEINKTSLQKLYTCHCTGETAYNILREHCNCPVEYIHTGDELVI